MHIPKIHLKFIHLMSEWVFPFFDDLGESIPISSFDPTFFDVLCGALLGYGWVNTPNPTGLFQLGLGQLMGKLFLLIGPA